MTQMGDAVPPYPVGNYGEPGPTAPPAGFYMGYQPDPNQPVMYQPGPGDPPQQPIHMPVQRQTSRVVVNQITGF